MRPIITDKRIRHYSTITLPDCDIELLCRAAMLTADKVEGSAGRLHNLAPELRRRATRLRRIVGTIDAQVDAGR